LIISKVLKLKLKVLIYLVPVITTLKVKPALWPVTLLTPPGLSVQYITRDHRIHYYLLKLLNIFKHQIHQL